MNMVKNVEEQSTNNVIQIYKSYSDNSGFMQVNSLENAMRAAEIISKSSFCPSNMRNPGDIVLALQMGQELGLKPMQALQNIAVINGKPCLYGDAQLALCRQSPDFEDIEETYSEADNSYTCRVKRRGQKEAVYTFSEKDARVAKLWGKPGPWTTYPKRMLQRRARGFALMDTFGDLLKGFISSYEAMDFPKNNSKETYVSDEDTIILESSSIDSLQSSSVSKSAAQETMVEQSMHDEITDETYDTLQNILTDENTKPTPDEEMKFKKYCSKELGREVTDLLDISEELALRMIKKLLSK